MMKTAKELIEDRISQGIDEDSYTSGEVMNFVKKNQDAMGEYFPTLKLFGQEGDTKHLNVTFDALKQIAQILKKMKT